MKAIIFDFDGTLVDSFDLAVECVNSLSEKYNFKPINDSRELRGKSMRDIIKKDLKLKWFQLPFFGRDFKKMFRKKMSRARPYPRIINALKELSKTKKIFILTSNISHVVEDILTKNKVHFIESIYSNVSLFKKDKLILNLMEKYGLKKENTAYVGDEVRDVEACKKIDLRVIAVSWGFNNKSILQRVKPDYLVDTPEELLSVVNVALK